MKYLMLIFMLMFVSCGKEERILLDTYKLKGEIIDVIRYKKDTDVCVKPKDDHGDCYAVRGDRYYLLNSYMNKNVILHIEVYNDGFHDLTVIEVVE